MRKGIMALSFQSLEGFVHGNITPFELVEDVALG
jgi:hypothetical protein